MTRPADDHYPTPPEATRALLSVEQFGAGIWEPCAGSGEMAAVLRQAGYTVAATTLHDGRADRDFPKHRVIGGTDFLAETRLRHHAIVTNPPYRIAEEIIRHALSLRPQRVAMLLNLKFLGSKARRAGLFAETPPARVWVFADRISMYPAGWDGPRATTTETMAWFVWDAPFRRVPPAIGWIEAGEHRGAAE
ncbi:hypothetical protein [Novispirillum itersonii]|uniref:hypothetical protein n=1 Tax=Novispirillum itersonii TaxID=189 RepID=UPI000377AE97|nr:hypothetical protein [Novispirillum itersonii]